jgi:hypothetical protein
MCARNYSLRGTLLGAERSIHPQSCLSVRIARTKLSVKGNNYFFNSAGQFVTKWSGACISSSA